MSTFWEPPPLLAIGAVVGSVILAYAVGFATAPAPATEDAPGNGEHSGGDLQDVLGPSYVGNQGISHAEDQAVEAQTDPITADVDPQSATKS